MREKVDISENNLRARGKILDILLLDKTRSNSRGKHNILWATESYENLGKDFLATKEILRENITGKNGKLIQPRAAKTFEEQKKRVKDKAEVFTPLKIVREMNENVAKSLEKTKENWRAFCEKTWLEIACGEAPFVASRYDPTKNAREILPPSARVGFLDEKLKTVSRNCADEKSWLKWAEISLKNCYAYEFCGDNLLLARENILLTIDDFFREKFSRGLSTEILENFAEITAWNIFQMDGINFKIPLSYSQKGHFYFAKNQNVSRDGKPKKADFSHEKTLPMMNFLGIENAKIVVKKNEKNAEKYFAKNEKIVNFATGIPVKIMDWRKNKVVKFGK